MKRPTTPRAPTVRMKWTAESTIAQHGIDKTVNGAKESRSPRRNQLRRSRARLSTMSSTQANQRSNLGDRRKEDLQRELNDHIQVQGINFPHSYSNGASCPRTNVLYYRQSGHAKLTRTVLHEPSLKEAVRDSPLQIGVVHWF